MQNLRKSGTPRAQKLHALGQRALRILHNVAESLLNHYCISYSKRKASSVGITQIFPPNSRERIAKFPKFFGAQRAQKLRELGQRGCAKRRTSLQLLSESVCVLMQDKSRVQRRDDANLAQNSREKFENFPEIRHAPRTKNCMHSASAAHTSQRR